MKRRTFLKLSVAAAVALAADPVQAESPRCMKHLYDNGDGELVAANTIEEASHYHDVELAGHDEVEAKELLADWSQIDDGARVPIIDSDDHRTPPTIKTAREWASDFDHVEIAASTYW